LELLSLPRRLHTGGQGQAAARDQESHPRPAAEVARRHRGSQARELYRRLRLDVVEDQEALEGASVDRVRECFRVLVRSFKLSDNEDEYPPPARNLVCFVLDSERVDMLADLDVFDDYIQVLRVHKKCKLQAVDIN
jgi:hypothetical protein